MPSMLPLALALALTSAGAHAEATPAAQAACGASPRLAPELNDAGADAAHDADAANDADADADMTAASAEHAAADALLAADPERAIQRYEAALRRTPRGPGYAPARARTLLALVDAHIAANARDDGPDLASLCRARARLLRAQALLDRYLGPLALLDEEARRGAEDRRIGLLAALHAQDGRILREKAARDAAAARRRGRRLTLSGAALVSGGAVGLALMAGGVVTGRAADDQLPREPCPDGDPLCREDLELISAFGARSNVIVLSGAVIGGSLVLGGVTLLLLGRGDRRRADAIDEESRRLWVELRGPGLALRGRF
jgi:hypothetical protein